MTSNENLLVKGGVRFAATAPARDALTLLMNRGQGAAMASYRSRLRSELDRPIADRELDLSGNPEHGRFQNHLLELVSELEATGFVRVLMAGIETQGLGFCNQYAISRLLSVEGPTPPEFFGKDGPYSCVTFVDGSCERVDEPSTGDLVWYCDGPSLGHYGIVVAACAPELTIESKFGHVPAVFHHPLSHVPREYGDRAVFFRLRGVAP